MFHLELIAIPFLTDGPISTYSGNYVRKDIYAMSTLHDPQGWVLTHRQRKELAAIARECRSWLLIVMLGVSANDIKGSRATGKKAHQQGGKTTLQLAGETKNMTKNQPT
ncbi:TPA: hypothetical protein ACOVJJ_004494 [Klebsiella oxytoca]